MYTCSRPTRKYESIEKVAQSRIAGGAAAAKYFSHRGGDYTSKGHRTPLLSRDAYSNNRERKMRVIIFYELRRRAIFIFAKYYKFIKNYLF